MKVKELIVLLQTTNPDFDVVINDNGSILKTASVNESKEYNSDNADASVSEFYIVAEEW